MDPKTNRTILIGLILGVVLGALGGYLIPDVLLALDAVGRLFVNALRIIVLPLIISVVIVGMAGLGQLPKLTRATASALVYFAVTSVAAAVIGVLAVVLLRPGVGASASGAFIPDMVTRARATTFTDIFGAILPDNLLAAIADGNYLGLIILAIVIGAVLTTVGKHAKVVIDFFRVVEEVSLKLVGLVLYAAPVGLFVLVGSSVARNPDALGDVGSNLLLLTLTFVAALAVHGLIVLPIILRVMAHRSPVTYFTQTLPALLTAFGTSSSTAALPVTYRNVTEAGEVDTRAGALVLPLGTAINLNGTAIYLSIAAIFIAQSFGIGLSVFQIIAIAILGVVLSIFAAGIPGSALYALTILMAALNFPVEAFGVIGMLVLVDWLFDRGRAVVNVWSDAIGAAVVGETFEFKTARVTPVASAAAGKAPTQQDSTRSRGRGRSSDRGSDDSRRGRDQGRGGRGRDRETGRGRGRDSRSGRDRDSRSSRGRDTRPTRDRDQSSSRQQSSSRDDKKQQSMPKAPEPLRPPSQSKDRQVQQRGRDPRNDRRDSRGPRDSRRQDDSRSAASASTPATESVMEQRGQLAADFAQQYRGSQIKAEPEPQPEPKPEPVEDSEHGENKSSERQSRQADNRQDTAPEPKDERRKQPREVTVRRRPLDAERDSGDQKSVANDKPDHKSEPEKDSSSQRPGPEEASTPPVEKPKPRSEPEPKSEPVNEQVPTEPEQPSEPPKTSAEKDEEKSAPKKEAPELKELAGVMESLHSRARQSAKEEEERQKDATEQSDSERANATEKQDDEKDDQPVSFGRTRSRKGPPPSELQSKKSDDADEKSEVVDEGYSVDEVPSFGRGRKKKSGRR